MRKIFSVLVLVLASVVGYAQQAETLTAVAGSCNVLSVSAPGVGEPGDFYVTALFNDISGQWIDSSVVAGYILWDVDGNRFNIDSVDYGGIIDLWVTDLDTAGTVATGIGAIVQENDNYPFWVAGISQGLNQIINAHMVQMIGNDIASGGGGGTDNQTLAEVLTEGNSAGASDIDMNDNSVNNIDSYTINTTGDDWQIFANGPNLQWSQTGAGARLSLRGATGTDDARLGVGGLALPEWELDVKGVANADTFRVDGAYYFSTDPVVTSPGDTLVQVWTDSTTAFFIDKSEFGGSGSNQTLAQVLDEGNIANQNINLAQNSLMNVDTVRMDGSLGYFDISANGGPTLSIKLSTSGDSLISFNSLTGRTRINGAYDLPASDGTNNQVLTTNGAGDVSWETVSGSGASFNFDTLLADGIDTLNFNNQDQYTWRINVGSVTSVDTLVFANPSTAGVYNLHITSASVDTITFPSVLRVANGDQLGTREFVDDALFNFYYDGFLYYTSSYVGAFVESPAGDTTPTDLYDLVVWLDGESGVIENDNTSAESGDFVKEWQDQSGNGNHFYQDSLNQRPTFISSVHNGKPGIRFNSDSTQLLWTKGDVQWVDETTGEYSVFVVAAVTDTLFANSGLVGSDFDDAAGGSSYDRLNQLLVYNRGNSEIRSLTLTTPLAGNLVNVSASVDTFYTSSVVRGGANIEMWLDGVTALSTAISGTDQTIANPLTLGVDRWSEANPTSFGNFLDGDILEVIIYKRALSTIERQAIESYLQNKYSTW
jgi:hypothetical protein